MISILHDLSLEVETGPKVAMIDLKFDILLANKMRAAAVGKKHHHALLGFPKETEREEGTKVKRIKLCIWRRRDNLEHGIIRFNHI